MLFKKINLVDSLAAIFFLGLIVAVVVKALNPTEIANKKRDEKYLAVARTINESLKGYYSQKGNYPWVTLGIKKDSTASFGFVAGNFVGVGICGDPNCSSDGELIKSGILKNNFRDKFILENIRNFWVGKASGVTSQVYVCYQPLSKYNRDASCNDSSVYALDEENGTRSKIDCIAGSRWNSNSPWVICLPN